MRKAVKSWSEEPVVSSRFELATSLIQIYGIANRATVGVSSVSYPRRKKSSEDISFYIC